MTWTLFSVALVQFLSIFFFSFSSTGMYLIILLLFCLFSFSYYFIFKKRFGFQLSYGQYIICNLLFSLLVAMFSWFYFRLVMLNDDPFPYTRYIGLLLVNFLVGSVLYLFTLIKKNEI